MNNTFNRKRNKISSLLRHYTKTNNIDKRVELLTDLIHLYGCSQKTPHKNNTHYKEITEVITAHTKIVTKEALTTSEYTLLREEVRRLITSNGVVVKDTTIKTTETLKNVSDGVVDEIIIASSEELEDPVLTVKEELSTLDIRHIRRVMNLHDKTVQEKLNTLSIEYARDFDTIKRWLGELGLSTAPTQYENAMGHSLKESKRYLITSAQSGCPVNQSFLANMKAYAESINAEIGIIATRYLNPTSVWKTTKDVWAREVRPYLIAKNQYVHKEMCVLPEWKIQATAANPLAGLESIEGTKSIVVGAPTVEFKSVPMMVNYEQKFLYSTGTVTVPGFSDTVAGSRAKSRHNYGFVIIEIENDKIVHARNVIAEDTGAFNDLVYRVENEKISTEDIPTMIWGDMHFAQKNPDVTSAFRGACTDLGVTQSILHDVWDSQCLNVHNVNNAEKRTRLIEEGRHLLTTEISQLKEELQWFDENMARTVVVRSNHDDMIDRMLQDLDWRHNEHNAVELSRLLNIKLSGKAPKGIIPYIIDEEGGFENIWSLGLSSSYVQGNVELALHGHKASNGARGSIASFAKMPILTVVGHSHSPSIKGNCFQVGVACNLEHDYNEGGMSGWAYASCILNDRGARQMIVLHKDTLTYTTLY